MKSLIVFFVAFLLVACGAQDTNSATAGDVQLHIEAPSETLAVGESVLRVTLQDASGAPVDGATVNVHANMDHEGMDAIDVEIHDSADGVYFVPVVWSMGGGWIVTVIATLPDGGEVRKTVDYFVEAVPDQSIINQPVD